MNDSIQVEAAAERLRSGEAWRDFCAVLADAGRMIEQFPDASDTERAEWFRWLTRLMRVGAERFIENCEPYRPRLQPSPWRTTVNVQMPTQEHYLLEFDEPTDFVIRGNRGTVPYFVFAAWSARQPADLAARSWAATGYRGLDEFDPAQLNTTAFLSSDEIEYDDNGDFEIQLSTKQQPGNWLALRTDSVGVLLRVVHHHRDHESPPALQIHRVDGAKPRPITAAEASAGLAKMAQWVLGYTELVRAWWWDNLGQRPNQLRFSRATYLSNGGVPDRHFAFGAWERPSGHALVVDFSPPDCEAWIFQLCNIWHENLDCYEEEQGYVTRESAYVEPDGRVRIVITDDDPGIGRNWVDTYGHTRGVWGLRLIKTDRPPPVRVWLVPSADLRARGWASLDGLTPIETGEFTE